MAKNFWLIEDSPMILPLAPMMVWVQRMPTKICMHAVTMFVCCKTLHCLFVGPITQDSGACKRDIRKWHAIPQGSQGAHYDIPKVPKLI